MKQHAILLFKKGQQVLFLLLLLECLASPQAGGGGGAGGKGGPTAKPGNPDAVHDIVTGVFISKSACALNVDAQTMDITADLKTLADGKRLDWNNSHLKTLVSAYDGTLSSLDSGAAYIFHVSNWTRSDEGDQNMDSPPYGLASSSWYVYVATRNGQLKQSGFRGTGDPLIYGKKRALIIGLDIFSSGKKGFLVSTYNISVTQGTPENQQNLGQLAAALLGISGGAAQPQAGFVPITCSLFIAAKSQDGSKTLPYDLSVTAATTDSTANPTKSQTAGQNSSPGTASCSGNGNATPCTTNRIFTSLDREWWDVSIGVTIPGVRETQFSIANNVLQTSVTRHTDLYGMFDFFPAFAYLPKESWFPHINVGVPLASKSLYRPYFGLAQNLTGWTHLQKNFGLPVGINFFAGAVWMKTSVVSGNPTTAAQLTSDTSHTRVWKVLFGAEVPISSIVSKIGKGGGSKNSSGSGKSGGGGG